MSEPTCKVASHTEGERSIRFVVAARRPNGLFLAADFSTVGRAEIAIASNMDRDPLEVVCAEVWRAANGNIRMWQHDHVRVLVDLVDPAEGFIGGDDIETVPATLNLQSGEILLDNPKQGHPLLNWSDTGVCISFSGSRYYARIVHETLPLDIAGGDVADFIREHGYAATINLASLSSAAGARQS